MTEPPPVARWRKCLQPLTSLAHAVRTHARESVRGFQDFLLRGKISELAAAFIIGSSFNDLVSSFIKHMFTPIIGIVTGTHTPMSDVCLRIRGECIAVGNITVSVLTFVVTLLSLYYVFIVPMDGLLESIHGDRYRTRDCPACYTRIPTIATKCSACSSDVPAWVAVADTGQQAA